MKKLLEMIFAPRQLDGLYGLSPLLRELLGGVGLKRAAVLLLAVFEIFGLLLFDTPRTPIGPPLKLTGYSIVFEDNFDGDALDLEKWEYRATGGRAGGYMHPDQVRVEDGKLILKAEYLRNGAFGEGWYSGMLRTKGEYVRGYFEMTCICSKGGGFWSAWWLNSRGMTAEQSQGGVGGAEIDIFEAFNYKKTLGKDSVSLNIHVNGYGDELTSRSLGNWNGKNIYSEYNTYGLLWTETEYIFYINGIEAVRSSFEKGVSEFPEYGIISLELPGADAFSEPPGFSTEFIVDSVRIWQKV